MLKCSIPRLGGMYTQYGICRLDCITTVVDALRLQDEFACGNDLTRKGIDEEDIENLIIQQIEFCNIILLNKAAEVKPEELERIKQIIRTLQPAAEIIECNYADVDLKKIIHTDLFDFERVATSAGTVSESDEDICLKVDTSKDKDAHELWKMLYAWKEQADKLSSEEISKDKYDEGRYHYPEFDTTQTWAKVPSQKLSNALVGIFQDRLKPDKYGFICCTTTY